MISSPSQKMEEQEAIESLGNIASGNYFDALKKKHDLSGLSAVRVLLVDNDVHVSAMVQSILNRLGFGTIFCVRDGNAALKEMEDRDIDMVISEWPMRPKLSSSHSETTDIVRTIRQHKSDHIKKIPIILLTAKGEREHVYDARDAGTTEFVLKPFSVYSLSARLVNIIENPREFVIAPNYVGPDRRRKKDADNPATSRRMSEEEKRANSVRKGRMTIITTPQGEVQIADPDYTIRQRIGMDVDVRALLSEQSISNAQEAVNEKLDEFFDWISTDMVWLEHQARLLKKGIKREETIEKLVTILRSIASKSGLFSYDFGTSVARSLLTYVQDITVYQKEHHIVIRKHIDVLYVIFQQYIEGKGGAIGSEMLGILSKLKKRYPAISDK